MMKSTVHYRIKLLVASSDLQLLFCLVSATYSKYLFDPIKCTAKPLFMDCLLFVTSAYVFEANFREGLFVFPCTFPAIRTTLSFLLSAFRSCHADFRTQTNFQYFCRLLLRLAQILIQQSFQFGTYEFLLSFVFVV